MIQGFGKLHCNSFKIKQLRCILAFAPRSVPCTNGDCRSDVARGQSAEHLTARSAVPAFLRQLRAVSTTARSRPVCKSRMLAVPRNGAKTPLQIARRCREDIFSDVDPFHAKSHSQASGIADQWSLDDQNRLRVRNVAVGELHCAQRRAVLYALKYAPRNSPDSAALTALTSTPSRSSLLRKYTSSWSPESKGSSFLPTPKDPRREITSGFSLTHSLRCRCSSLSPRR